jgi:hypothetical protein
MAQECLDAIGTLQAELTALKAANRWIPVSERLPETHTEVMFYDTETGMHFGFYHNGAEIWCGNYTLDPSLNVTHWQSSSEQRHVLHASRVLLLAADEDVRADRGKKVELTQDSLLVGLKGIRYVTLDTGPIETGAKDLEAIEARMRTVAGQALTKPTGPAKTATESAQESRDGGSRLRRWTWDFQDFFEQCMKLMAAWIGEKQGGAATVDTDWDDLMDPSLFATALQARVQRELSRDAWLQLAQRAGVLQGSVEDEKDRLDAEPPEPLSAGLMGGAA